MSRSPEYRIQAVGNKRVAVTSGQANKGHLLRRDLNLRQRQTDPIAIDSLAK